MQRCAVGPSHVCFSSRWPVWCRLKTWQRTWHNKTTWCPAAWFTSRAPWAALQHKVYNIFSFPFSLPERPALVPADIVQLSTFSYLLRYYTYVWASASDTDKPRWRQRAERELENVGAGLASEVEFSNHPSLWRWTPSCITRTVADTYCWRRCHVGNPPAPNLLLLLLPPRR